MAKIIKDINGNNVVVIDSISFRGKRNIDWTAVKEYLKNLVGEVYEITDTHDLIYIGNDFPNEYSGSRYTYLLKGAAAKAKANASQGIPELLRIATGKYYKENNEEKHKRNAKNGWYRYNSRFALPVLNEKGEIERYNIFHASMLIRYDENGKMYLYDMIDIKKETSNPLGP